MLVYQRESHGHENDDWMICGYHILGNVMKSRWLVSMKKAAPIEQKVQYVTRNCMPAPLFFPKGQLLITPRMIYE